MPGTPVVVGPWVGGLHNASGTGEGIEDNELFELVNLEVDTDKSLTNRPAIRELTLSGMGATTNIKIIGTYLPEDGREFLVATIGSTCWLVDASTGAGVISQAVDTVCCVQYNNRLWIIPQSAGNGGYFDVPTSVTTSWTAAAAIPAGQSAVIYKTRVFVTGGLISGATNTSRCYYSDVDDPTTWPGANNFDVFPGNGQKAAMLLTVGDSIMVFKEHSTYNYGYASDPSRADLKVVDAKIGTPATNCAVVYKNNTLYVLHDNSIYELYNNVYTRISDNLLMSQVSDASLYSTDIYGLTIYRDRLFARYYSKLYVLGLGLQRWSQWETERKFSRLAVIPSSTVGLDTAYAASATSDEAGKVFFFRDDRITEVGVEEDFDCRITTKMYDYNTPAYYKRIFMGVLQIASSGAVTITATVPSSALMATWDEWKALYTWASINAANVTWRSNGDVVITTSIQPSSSSFTRKAIKCFGKMRFRQIQFGVTTAAETNSVADASVRIYDITTFVSQAETLVKESS